MDALAFATDRRRGPRCAAVVQPPRRDNVDAGSTATAVARVPGPVKTRNSASRAFVSRETSRRHADLAFLDRLDLRRACVVTEAGENSANVRDDGVRSPMKTGCPAVGGSSLRASPPSALRWFRRSSTLSIHPCGVASAPCFAAGRQAPDNFPGSWPIDRTGVAASRVSVRGREVVVGACRVYARRGAAALRR